MSVCSIPALAEVYLTKLSQFSMAALRISTVTVLLVFFFATELVHLITKLAIESQRTNLSNNASFFFGCLGCQNVTIIFRKLCTKSNCGFDGAGCTCLILERVNGLIYSSNKAFSVDTVQLFTVPPQHLGNVLFAFFATNREVYPCFGKVFI